VRPWFHGLYGAYSRYIIPAAGLLIAGSREAYEYLPDSIKKFPLPGALAEEMRQAGFCTVSYGLLTGGIAAIHCADKR
jgi:demethylmenaquinone methyltransferase/2-methoxy-6-polyprenyl-1,4-benzoquinol methylase